MRYFLYLMSVSLSMAQGVATWWAPDVSFQVGDSQAQNGTLHYSSAVGGLDVSWAFDGGTAMSWTASEYGVGGSLVGSWSGDGGVAVLEGLSSSAWTFDVGNFDMSDGSSLVFNWSELSGYGFSSYVPEPGVGALAVPFILMWMMFSGRLSGILRRLTMG